MPKKRHKSQLLKTSLSDAQASSSSATTSSRNSDRPTKGVNELLANLRRSSLGPARPNIFAPGLSPNSPTIPPSLRQILQIPETPVPVPSRHLRTRFDAAGRRTPAGPPPPRSWVSSRTASEGPAKTRASLAAPSRPPSHNLDGLPDVYAPERGSFIEMILRSMATNWEDHRVYDQTYLYYLPSHLKPPLIRLLGLDNGGVNIADLKLLLKPPDEGNAYGADVGNKTLPSHSNSDITYLDLTNSIGDTLRLKDVLELIHPTKGKAQEGKDDDDDDDVIQDSWDQSISSSGPPRSLIPNLSHLSLALRPTQVSDISWRQLVNHAPKLTSITHLSLAYWPVPCLTAGTKTATVSSPTGLWVPYAGTNIYSHVIDHDWSEALLVLRLVAKHLYKLEYLDLTGCTAWFEALVAQSEHDQVDWVGSWGKVTRLRLRSGWNLIDESLPSERIAYQDGMRMAANVERHIRARRAGKGRFITVERDEEEVLK